MAEREPVLAPLERLRMRGPHRFVVRMLLFLVLVAALAYALSGALLGAFLGNPAVNGVILGILIAGIIYIFRQVFLLGPATAWIDRFRERLANKDLTAPPGPAPRLLAPMARMLGSRQSGRVSLSATSLQTLLDGIASRLDETRETSRYLIGVLVFLGLLGTFYGLLETVRSVGDVIGALNVGASDLARAFADLKTGLESPLHGMAIAFSASLFGLAGSLVLGFLDLQAGQAQNRFYNDLEEWLSTYTRLSSGPFGDGSDGSMPAYLHALLEQTADSLENLQHILARSEESRISTNTTLAGLTDRLGIVGEHMKAGQSLMVRLAENQMELKPSLVRLATIAENSLGQDDVLRTHLRNIEAYMARLTEDVAEGRAQSVKELRGEIRLIARTIAALAEEGGR
ncbi:MAG TPA: flagellar motor protein MotA [Stellaceae bacterium]|nr:flagellar motor protein MotA [Stellaceae bacterium]